MDSTKKINMTSIESVKDSLDLKSLKVCVIGIGRIGLPTALSFANAGLKTIGVDINQNLIDCHQEKSFTISALPGYFPNQSSVVINSDEYYNGLTFLDLPSSLLN